MKTPETKAFKTLIRGIDGDKHWVPAGFAEILERERDEARADAAALADKLSGLELRTTEELARLEQERDEAREKYDNEATEHMLAVNKLAEERDEAREERDSLKQELEIVTARLHGKKHPMDNGIPERREIYIWKNGKYELDP